MVFFELDQRDEAMRELHRRLRRGEGAAFVEVLDTLGRHTAAMQRHDWPAMAQVLDPDLVVDDRRFAGIGLVVGRDQYLDALAALHELSADLTIEAVAILALDTHAIVTLSRTHGHLADGGGVVENAFAFLGTVADGRVTRIEMFDVAEVDLARARFEELRPDPLAIPPNSASRTQEAVSKAREAGDWDGIRALCAPGMVFRDHQRGAQVDGDREALVGTNRSIGRRGRRVATWLATMGDRLALSRVRFSSDWQGTEWEVELVGLYEVDAQGLILRNDSFSVEDRAEAFAEMEHRFVAAEGAESAAAQAPIVAFDEAFRRRDWKALRAVLSDDFVATDNRPGWMGSSDRAEYVESMRVFAELSPDVASETMRLLAWADHGRVAMTRVRGTHGDAGPFENVFVWMLRTTEGKIEKIEVWPVDDAGAALENFSGSRPES
jgi:ketosteroid isomerase-like protein